MAHYVVSFIVYTLAMSGLIALALFVYKKAMNGSIGTNKTKLLSIEETMNINPRKTLMIVRAGDERFLIASDVDKTSLLAKLEDKNNSKQLPKISEQQLTENKQTVKNDVMDLTEIKNNIDKNNMGALFPQTTKEKKVINNETKKSQTQPVKEKNTTKQIHLEVINDVNEKMSSIRRPHSYTSRNHKKNVTIEVGEVKNHGLSTIKEMVHKVNEI